MSVGLATALQRLRSERAAETLKRGWPEMPPWVFCSEAETPLDLSNVTKAWRRVLKAAKLPAFRLYDLRHTFATELLAQGAPITYVAASSDTRSRRRPSSGTRTGSRAGTSTGSTPWPQQVPRLVVTNW
jgi:integrase